MQLQKLLEAFPSVPHFSSKSALKFRDMELDEVVAAVHFKQVPGRVERHLRALDLVGMDRPRDIEGRPVAVPPIECENEQQERRKKQAEARQEYRLKQAREVEASV